MPFDAPTLLNDEPEPERPEVYARSNDSNRRRLFSGPGNIEPLRPPHGPVKPKPRREDCDSDRAFKSRMWGYNRWITGYHSMLDAYEELIAEGALGYCKNCGIVVTATGRPAARNMPCGLFDCPFEGKGSE